MEEVKVLSFSSEESEAIQKDQPKVSCECGCSGCPVCGNVYRDGKIDDDINVSSDEQESVDDIGEEMESMDSEELEHVLSFVEDSDDENMHLYHQETREFQTPLNRYAQSNSRDWRGVGFGRRGWRGSRARSLRGPGRFSRGEWERGRGFRGRRLNFW